METILLIAALIAAVIMLVYTIKGYRTNKQLNAENIQLKLDVSNAKKALEDNTARLAEYEGKFKNLSDKLETIRVSYEKVIAELKNKIAELAKEHNSNLIKYRKLDKKHKDLKEKYDMIKEK